MTTGFPAAPSIVDSNRVLYTASSFARGALLHLQEIGTLTALQPHVSSRSNLASYLFFMVQDGTGTLTYDSREYSLRAGSCVFIDCRKPYRHSTEKELWTLRWIHFDGPMLSSIYEKYRERGGQPVFCPGEEDLKAIQAAWTSLMETVSGMDYMRDMRINALLADLLVCLMAESWHPEAQKRTPKRTSVLDVKEWIDENYAQSITLDRLSSLFYINKYYLSKTFKAQFGQTINSYLTTVRITHAKQLLRFTDRSLETIGEAVGITPARYFSEVFTAVEGISPSLYRKQW